MNRWKRVGYERLTIILFGILVMVGCRYIYSRTLVPEPLTLLFGMLFIIGGILYNKRSYGYEVASPNNTLNNMPEDSIPSHNFSDVKQNLDNILIESYSYARDRTNFIEFTLTVQKEGKTILNMDGLSILSVIRLTADVGLSHPVIICNESVHLKHLSLVNLSAVPVTSMVQASVPTDRLIESLSESAYKRRMVVSASRIQEDEFCQFAFIIILVAVGSFIVRDVVLSWPMISWPEVVVIAVLLMQTTFALIKAFVESHSTVHTILLNEKELIVTEKRVAVTKATKFDIGSIKMIGFAAISEKDATVSVDKMDGCLCVKTKEGEVFHVDFPLDDAALGMFVDRLESILGARTSTAENSFQRDRVVLPQ